LWSDFVRKDTLVAFDRWSGSQPCSVASVIGDVTESA